MNNCEKKLDCNIISMDKNCNIVINDNTFDDNYVLVFIIKLTTLKDTSPTQTIIKDKCDKLVVFNYLGDGFYTICKLTIPINEAEPYYYKNGKFYHNIQEVSLLEIVNINPLVSKIDPEYLYYFSTCSLKKCFIKICQDIFDSKMSICSKLDIDSSLTYKRDLLWSAINVINYMVEMDQIEEALRLLEEITSCNGLCSPQTSYSRCGCGR